MKCAEIRELLVSDYLDGELGETARGEVAGHLDACGGCRRFEGDVRRLAVEPFRDAPRETAPASLWTSVRRGIEEGRDRGPRAALARAWRSLRIPAYVAASAAAVIVAVSLVRAPVGVTGGTRTPPADAEELYTYLEEQYSTLAYNGGNGPDEQANGDAANGSSPGNFGTLVEEYLM